MCLYIPHSLDDELDEVFLAFLLAVGVSLELLLLELLLLLLLLLLRLLLLELSSGDDELSESLDELSSRGFAFCRFCFI